MSAPRTAVVIPSFNRPGRLAACLEALLADPAGDFEIVVVDDGSPEPLAPVCARHGPRVRCLRQDNAGPAAARNAGVAGTQADFIAFTDDDCRPRPGWVAALRAAQAGDPMRLVGGHVENALPDDPYASASQSLCDHLYAHFGAREGDAPFFTSNNIGCDRDRFLALGGFDDSFPLAAAEDRDFGLRWRAAGGTLVFAAEAVVDHAHAMSLGRFWRQHRNYGRGARHLHRRLDARGDTRPRREPIGFYLGLVLAPMRAGGLRRLPTSALMVLSQMAMVRGYLAERAAERRTGHGPRRGPMDGPSANDAARRP